ncbi:hypothetical protein IFU32_23625 [Bacillus megaterium]|nr:hypothetical protein [Priestia megaterium]
MREEFKKYGYSPTHTEVYKPFPAISDDRSGKIIKRNKSIAWKGCFYEGI